MATTNYKCRLHDGTTVTIEGVSRVEKDGSGRRFYDAEDHVIAAFDDGQSSAHWPANAPVAETVPGAGNPD